MAEREGLERVLIQARSLGNNLDQAYGEMMVRMGDTPDGIILGFSGGPKMSLLEFIEIAKLAGRMLGIVDGIEMRTQAEPEIDPAILEQAQSLAIKFHSVIAEDDLANKDDY